MYNECLPMVSDNDGRPVATLRVKHGPCYWQPRLGLAWLVLTRDAKSSCAVLYCYLSNVGNAWVG